MVLQPPKAVYPVGSHVPSTSRYKCFYEYLRPTAMFQDANGNVLMGPSPGLTLCTLDKGHEGDHCNNRGEESGNQGINEVSEWHKAEMMKISIQFQKMQKAMEAQAEELAKLKAEAMEKSLAEPTSNVPIVPTS